MALDTSPRAFNTGAGVTLSDDINEKHLPHKQKYSAEIVVMTNLILDHPQHASKLNCRLKRVIYLHETLIQIIYL